MRQRKFKAPPRKTLRRWRVPPALTHGDTDAFEGLSVLDELPGELGMVLWQSLRDAMLWGRSLQAERSALFAEGADHARIAALLACGAPVEVEEPVKAIATLLATAETAREENVALACRELSQWGEARGHAATALAFAQAAAVVTPADPAASYRVGLLARRRGEHARAETWFRRTVALARQLGDWPTYALAFVGLGNLYAIRGNYPAAKRFLIRALRAATRNSLHDIAAMAQHDLFAVAVNTGDTAEAHEWARRAFESYGPLHPGLVRLAHDVAYFWTTQGEFSNAIPVFRSVLAHPQAFDFRIATVCDLARACGGASDREGFAAAWDQAMELLRANPDVVTASRGWVDLGHGALSLGLWERAEEAATRATDAAGKHHDGAAKLAAEAVADAARRRLRADQRQAAARQAWTESAESLAQEFVASLGS